MIGRDIVSAALLGLLPLGAVVAVVLARASDASDADARLADACDLAAGACVVSLDDDASLELRVAPLPIAPARPLALRATFRGADPDRAELLVTSTTMDMGETAIPLARVAPGELAGEGALPVCVTREMTWLADLHLPGRDAPVASFRFDTHTRQP